MKPERMPSRWVKVLPWYYAERRQPSRAASNSKAVDSDLKASNDPPRSLEEVNQWH